MHQAPDYRREAWLESGQHAVTALIETAHARGRRVRRAHAGWEDWDFYQAGHCGRVRARPQPLLVYRQETGTVREASLAQKDTLLAVLRDRYAGYATGEKPMSTMLRRQRRCPPRRQARAGAGKWRRARPMALPDTGITEPSVVRMEFTGSQRGAVSYLGGRAGAMYLGGNNPFDKYVDADPRDVAHLESLGVGVVPGQRLGRTPTTPRRSRPAPTVEARPSGRSPDMAPELAANEAVVNTAAAAMARNTKGGRKVA